MWLHGAVVAERPLILDPPAVIVVPVWKDQSPDDTVFGLIRTVAPTTAYWWQYAPNLTVKSLGAASLVFPHEYRAKGELDKMTAERIVTTLFRAEVRDMHPIGGLTFGKQQSGHACVMIVAVEKIPNHADDDRTVWIKEHDLLTAIGSGKIHEAATIAAYQYYQIARYERR
ncbi:MAG: hypothetical protein HW383_519 [Candidatus Magasanikbacteria bacterium]|nr:hypothetical protein [Candidatus Magasanikbacteria bacterium]